VCCFELVCVGMSCVEVMSRMEVSLLGVCDFSPRLVCLRSVVAWYTSIACYESILCLHAIYLFSASTHYTCILCFHPCIDA